MNPDPALVERRIVHGSGQLDEIEPAFRILRIVTLDAPFF
jgi:hypothetical protein